ncbi:MAG: amidohydrolase [Chthoniobacterales bacterium]
MKAQLFRKPLIFGLIAVTPCLFGAEEATTLFLNGNIYTGAHPQPHAEAVAATGQRIVFVGSNADAKQKFPGARIVDLGGRTVLPGLTDSHCHIFGIGERELQLNLEGTNSREVFLTKVAERVKQTPPGKWVQGRGWIETFWKPPQFPTRQDLDAIAPANPVYLTRADGHASVANSAALRMAGIDRNTPDPFGGRILKDARGEPTGMLLDQAQDIVGNQVPQPSEADREQALLAGIDREIKLGWCEIQNAGSHRPDVVLIRRAYATGKIRIRMYNAVYGPGADAETLLSQSGMGFEPMSHREDADATLKPAKGDYDGRFTQRTIKVIFDGALGSRGAALLKPYSDAPDTSGYLTAKPEELRPMFAQALRQGVQVETHAIGDRANRIILDLYEEAFKAVPQKERRVAEAGQPITDGAQKVVSSAGSQELAPPSIRGGVRWRVEHAQILDPADLPRFARLGVIASMQPSHAISDLFFAPARLGLERLTGAYAWQSLLKSGTIICGGSDAPVERGEPMIEFYAAVARESIRGESSEGWHPEQAVTRGQALKIFTIWPAYAAFEENDKGSLEPGKLADMTVVSADIMKIPEPDILKTRCEMTIIGGEVVYDATKN